MANQKIIISKKLKQKNYFVLGAIVAVLILVYLAALVKYKVI